MSNNIVNNKIKNVNEQEFKKYLYTKDIEDPDLLIRPGREKRISNFFLWQIAYSEIYFSDILWPDFNEEHLDNIIVDFQNRERRYGITNV